MIKVDCVQGSPEWFQIRAGIPSSSNFDKILTPSGLPSKQTEKYLYTLAGERIAGPQMDSYQSAAMERGKIIEAEARQCFELIQGMKGQEVGFVYFDEKKQFGASPDEIFPDTGLEIKCPLIHTHVQYLLSGKLPNDYIPQVQGSMLVCSFTHYWFMSYYPGLPPLILDIQRDMDYTAKLKVELNSFCDRLDAVEKELRGME